ILTPLAALIGFIASLIPIALTRYVSLGSITGAVVSIIAAAALLPTRYSTFPHFVYILCGGLFIIASHRDNIERLLSGTERKLGQPTD
ncbi:MAG: glycerol-3-phosphate acyltransferase, partial [Ktedonobacterales bacterium]|nr:glycerol-3-phosphate acyltransferase [Ktedonobacterales bacterium]